MPDTIRCPQCGSENVIFSKKRSIHVCEDCEHAFALEKPFVPKRLFISYGHDAHIPLAIRLRDDLRRRGHNVWFDEERLQPGHDWEIQIEQGIEHLVADKSNAAVILLLTPHSVRRPDGYCLNEVARALGRGLRIIPLMVVESEPPLSICRIQWLDMRECIPIQNKEALYVPRFERLLKAIEENQVDFEGTQQRLIKALQPLEFDAEILSHCVRFTGRKWVFDRINEWLKEDTPRQRVFWIAGGPGAGKTALSAVIASRYPEIVALHLCKFGHAQKSNPGNVVSSLAYQMSTQLPQYEALLATSNVETWVTNDASSMFDNLIVQQLVKLTGPARPVVILIDALDEATEGNVNQLARFIAAEFPKTPKWLRLIITSRPEEAVTAPLQSLSPFILDTETESNRADIREYVQRELATVLIGHSNANLVMAQIVEKSEGVFLYAQRFCDDVLCGYLSLAQPAAFPQGLGGSYYQFFCRQFPDATSYRNQVRSVLRAILGAHEPLPVAVLQRLFAWQDEELADFTRMLGSLFPVTIESGQPIIQPYHKSVADWLGDRSRAGDYFVSPAEGRRMLEQYCLQHWTDGSSFAVSGAIFYPQQFGHDEQFAELLSVPRFYDAAFAAGQGTQLVDAITKFAGNCNAGDGSIDLTNNPSLLSDVQPIEQRARFLIVALALFSRELPRVPSTIAALRQFIEGGFDGSSLEAERKMLAPELGQARAAPRIPRTETNYHAANTAHYYEDYLEQRLEAIADALSLSPERFRNSLWSALHAQAIASCDGDPRGAVNYSIQEAKEEMDATWKLLWRVAKRISPYIQN